MFIGHSIADSDGIILGIDAKVCELMEREQRDLLNVGYTKITHPDDRVRNMAIVERLGDGAGSMALRKRYMRPNGSAVWVNVRVSRLSKGFDAGRLVGTIWQVEAGQDHEPNAKWRAARRIQAQLSQRRSELGEDLFLDHAWQILVEIYLAEVEGRNTDSLSICEAVHMKLPTTTRWLTALENKGLVDRDASPVGTIQLTCDGLSKVGRLLETIVGDDLAR